MRVRHRRVDTPSARTRSDEGNAFYAPEFDEARMLAALDLYWGSAQPYRPMGVAAENIHNRPRCDSHETPTP